MATDKTILQMALAQTLSGSESFPFATPGANGRATANTIKGFVSPKMWEVNSVDSNGVCAGNAVTDFAEIRAGDTILLPSEVKVRTSLTPDSSGIYSKETINVIPMPTPIVYKTEDDAFFWIYGEDGVNYLLTLAGNELVRFSMVAPRSGSLPEVAQTASEVTIQPGVLNKWGVVASLTIDLAAGPQGYAAEYCVEFVSGETPTVLSLPESVKFPDQPEIEANTRYQLSIVNNLALIVGVPFDYGDAELASPAQPKGIAVLLKSGRKIDIAKMNPDSHFPKSVVEGIVVEKDGLSIIMDLDVVQCYFSNGKVDCAAVEIEPGINTAATKHNGRAQTDKLAQSFTADTTWAVPRCVATTLNGKSAYLWPLGEAVTIRNHRTEINTLRQICGCEPLPAGNYWTSSVANRATLDSGATAITWMCILDMTTTYMDGGNVQGYYRILPIAEYSEATE